jgi:DNA-binding IclR family transcriptional regulator
VQHCIRSWEIADLLNTIDRTGKVLNLFTAQTPEWGVTEVATQLGLPKSTTFDIVASLADIGLLQQTSDDRYRLGWRVLAISRRLMDSTCFTADAHRSVAEVANKLGAVVTIGVWDGEAVVSVANASGTSEPAFMDGAHISGYASALGKLLMAQLPWQKVQEGIDLHGLPRLTEKTVTDVDIFRAQLASARRRGIAFEHGETLVGRSCIAVGIRQREHQVIAALSICAPTARMHNRHADYARIALRTARSVLP